MKLKYYLRGLGVGILFSTIILSIAFRAALKEKSNEVNSKTNNNEVISSKEEVDALEDLLIPTVEPTKEPTKEPETKSSSNKVPSTTPTKSPTQEQADETTSSTENQAEGLTTPTKTASEDSSVMASEPDNEETNKSNENNMQVIEKTDKEEVWNDNNKEEQEYIIINIQKGMTSEEVASVLTNYGIVENKKEFNNYLKDNGYSTKIKIGDFKLSNDYSYEEITNIIVEK